MLLKVHRVNVIQTEIHTTGPLIPEPCAFEVKIAIEKLIWYETPSINKITAEFIQAGGKEICSDIHKCINSKWKKKELPQQQKQSITVPIYKKGDKTDSSAYWDISLLSKYTQKLSTNLLPMLTPFAPEIIGNHQCGFWHRRSTTDHTFCTFQSQILEKNGNTMQQYICGL